MSAKLTAKISLNRDMLPSATTQDKGYCLIQEWPREKETVQKQKLSVPWRRLLKQWKCKMTLTMCWKIRPFGKQSESVVAHVIPSELPKQEIYYYISTTAPCSLTRAVHLELLTDQTTKGVTKCLEQFIARWEIYEDTFG